MEENKIIKHPFELFGIECGSGWKKIYEPLIEKIKEYNEKNPDSPIQILQVKEKWGTLRFYVSSAPQEIYDLIDKAEKKSEITCEECGYTNPKKVKNKPILGWYRTLCPRCRERIEKEKKALYEKIENKNKN